MRNCGHSEVLSKLVSYFFIISSKRPNMPRKSLRRRRSSKKTTNQRPKFQKMRGGVTRKLLTRRKVADLTREIGLGHGGSLNTRIKEFVRPALTNQSIHISALRAAEETICKAFCLLSFI